MHNDPIVARLEEDVKRLNRVVLEGDGPDNPSLISTMLRMGDKLDDLKESIEGVPGRLAMWVAIFGGIISLLVFLGPSIRRSIGLAVDAQPTSSTASGVEATVPRLP